MTINFNQSFDKQPFLVEVVRERPLLMSVDLRSHYGTKTRLDKHMSENETSLIFLGQLCLVRGYQHIPYNIESIKQS